MKKRNAVLITAMAVVALAATPFLYAHGRGMRHGGGDAFGGGMLFGHLMHAKSELGLSDQQVDELKAIAKSLHEQNKQYREQMHSGMQAAFDALIANPNDIAGAQAALDRQSAVEQTMKVNALQAASKALNVLTPDQRTKLGQMVAAHREQSLR